MNDFVENFKANVQELWKRFVVWYAKLVKRPINPDGSVVSTKSTNTYEINLVPVVKAQMIKAQKVRNMVLFVCIVVSVAAAGVVLVLFGIKSGQDIAMSSQDKKLGRLSNTLNSYDELEDLVKIQGQLSKYAEIQEQKTVLSRVFGALGAMLPSGNDDVRLSELRVNMTTNVVNMEGQADARVAPLIDYRVLESFKKGVDLTKYDYGRYVDIDGKELPTQCIIEADEEGNALREGDSYYAWWDLTIEGCEGMPRSLSIESAEVEYHYSADAEVEMGVPGHETEVVQVCDENGENCKEEIRVVDLEPVTENAEVLPEGTLGGENVLGEGTLGTETTEEDEDLTPRPVRVRIWRTPQFDEWYEEGKMSMNGQITGMEHFETECYVYQGAETLSGAIRWTSTNDCLLAPKGLTISGSSNGRDESDNLVLRFTAAVTFAEEFFMFQNKHMIAIGPMGQNVTDSFVQIGGMFTQEARACDADDTECLGNGGGN